MSVFVACDRYIHCIYHSCQLCFAQHVLRIFRLEHLHPSIAVLG